MYFERDCIIGFDSRKSPQNQRLAESIYEDKHEKEVLESQRTSLMRQIKDEKSELKRSTETNKISDILQEAKTH